MIDMSNTATITTATNAIVGVNAEGTETVAADAIEADTFDVWTRINDGHGFANGPTLDNWVANFDTLEEAIAAFPEAEVLNG